MLTPRENANASEFMAVPFYFICYSRRDGEEIALTLADQLAAGPPSIPVWLDRRNLQPGIDWDEQIVGALRGGGGVLYLSEEGSGTLKPKLNGRIRTLTRDVMANPTDRLCGARIAPSLGQRSRSDEECARRHTTEDAKKRSGRRASEACSTQVSGWVNPTDRQ
jgi:hypothetical protein